MVCATEHCAGNGGNDDTKVINAIENYDAFVLILNKLSDAKSFGIINRYASGDLSLAFVPACYEIFH